MANIYPGSLLHCLDNGKATLIILIIDGAACVYTADMKFLVKVCPPFVPDFYLRVSKDEVLFFDMDNRLASANIADGVCTELTPPRGTSVRKWLAFSSVFKTEQGILFFPRDAFIRNTTFLYSFSSRRFKRMSIKIPEGCFSFSAGRSGVLYRQLGEGGDLQACSFETAYKKREFYPEFTMSKDLFSEYLDVSDVFDLSCKLAYISLEKKAIILVINNKLDQRFIREIIGMASHDRDGFTAGLEELARAPDSGKAVLIRDDEAKKEIPFNEFVCKGSIVPFCDDFILISHGKKLSAYSTDDLQTLASSGPSLFPRAILLPDGRILYEIKGGVCVTDSSPFSALFKTECAE